MRASFGILIDLWVKIHHREFLAIEDYVCDEFAMFTIGTLLLVDGLWHRGISSTEIRSFCNSSATLELAEAGRDFTVPNRGIARDGAGVGPVFVVVYPRTSG